MILSLHSLSFLILFLPFYRLQGGRRKDKQFGMHSSAENEEHYKILFSHSFNVTMHSTQDNKNVNLKSSDDIRTTIWSLYRIGPFITTQITCPSMMQASNFGICVSYKP